MFYELWSGVSNLAEALGEDAPPLAQLWDQLALLQFIQVWQESRWASGCHKSQLTLLDG